MTGEIHKMLFLVCIISSFMMPSIDTATTEILNSKEPAGVHKAKLVAVNKVTGHSAIMQCDLLSNDLTDVIWYRNGTNLNITSRHHISQSYQVLENTRIFNSRSTLKISSLTADDSGSYSCKLNNTSDSPVIFTLSVAPSNTVDLLFSGLLILGIIFTFILAIHIIKYAFTRRR